MEIAHNPSQQNSVDLKSSNSQWTLSGVFKAGDFHRNTGQRLLIDESSHGRYQQTTHSH